MQASCFFCNIIPVRNVILTVCIHRHEVREPQQEHIYLYIMNSAVTFLYMW
jgi:hypothetical protein